jgi:hypothetical protein
MVNEEGTTSYLVITWRNDLLCLYIILIFNVVEVLWVSFFILFSSVEHLFLQSCNFPFSEHVNISLE